jgi:hypothetical protein
MNIASIIGNCGGVSKALAQGGFLGVPFTGNCSFRSRRPFDIGGNCWSEISL